MKKFKTLFAFLCTLTVLCSYLPQVSAIDSVDLNSDYALLIEPSSGEILYEKNADMRTSPASLTKIMTALLVLEYGHLDEIVTVTASSLEGLHPESSTINLKPGEEVPLGVLLQCILIASGNDACNVAAVHVAGSVEAFVAEMNLRAAEIGCTDTHFMNTHGLTEEGHYTTARDIYKITLEALKHPEFPEICNTASITMPATNLSEERYFYTTNHLISRLKLPDYIYPYAKGIKTGHTANAGYCLVSSAEKNDLFLISVLLHADKEEETGRLMNFVDAKRLYEWAFSNFSVQTMISSKEPIREVAVRLALDTDYVVVNTSTSVRALLPNDFDPAQVVRTVTIYDEENITAPIFRGQKLGEMSLSYNNRDYGTLSLIALNAVSKDQTLYIVDQVKSFFAQKWVVRSIIAVVAMLVLYIVFVIFYNANRRKKKFTAYKGRKRPRR